MTNGHQNSQPEKAVVITSASNPTVKALKSLERKKGRREHDAFLAEGARLLGEALSYDWEPVHLIASPDGAERPVNTQLITDMTAQGAMLTLVNNRLLGSIARKDNPQTILASFRPKYRELSALNAKSLAPGSYVALYQVRDPGNLGTILRTADFAGVKGVILIGDCCDLYSLESVRASMGSLFAMPVYFAGEDEFLDWKQNTSAPMIAASMNGKTQHTDAPFNDTNIILMGNEQSGLPAQLEDACDTLARIPMRDGADSLNLGVATALMIYAAAGARGYTFT